MTSLTPKRFFVALLRFEMHLDRVEGGKDHGLPGETQPCKGFFKLLLFLPGSNGGNQDGEVADAERNTILDGA